jgi:metallophosphoesterase (TIGR00282 family)
MKVLFIGDIIGKIGRDTTKALLPSVLDKHKIDFVIANGENSAGGFGLTEKTVSDMFNCGIHVITTGNHVWDKKEFIPKISKEDCVLRPLNYPPGVPGFGSVLYPFRTDKKIAVVNLSGRVFMSNIDCPFRTGLDEIKRLQELTDTIIVDFHAEATSEKIAFGYFVDGRVSAVIGTHTHVQTADERVLPRGTAYITDAGMTGPLDSVIGVEKEQIIQRFLSGMPTKFETARGEGIFSAVIIEIGNNGKASSISRLQLKYP